MKGQSPRRAVHVGFFQNNTSRHDKHIVGNGSYHNVILNHFTLDLPPLRINRNELATDHNPVLPTCGPGKVNPVPISQELCYAQHLTVRLSRVHITRRLLSGRGTWHLDTSMCLGVEHRAACWSSKRDLGLATNFRLLSFAFSRRQYSHLNSGVPNRNTAFSYIIGG